VLIWSSSSKFEIEFVSRLPCAARAMTEVFIEGANDKMPVNTLRLALYQVIDDTTLIYMRVSKGPIRGGTMLDYAITEVLQAFGTLSSFYESIHVVEQVTKGLVLSR
jgi:hypothetical protein